MARKEAKEIEEKIEGNIPAIDELKKEYVSGKMPDRKQVALRTRLVSLFMDKLITEKEQELMEIILKRERVKATISSRDEHLLNQIESDRCEEKAIVKTDDAPVVHYLRRDMVCNFARDLEKDKFIIYVPRVIPTDHQLSVETVRKEMKGHPTTESDYPPPRKIIHRIVISKNEFKKWFEVEDEDILKPVQKEAEYTF